MKIILSLAALILWSSGVCAQDNRFWLNAEINGRPVRFVFDTGSTGTGLFPETVKRLGLEIDVPVPDIPPKNGRVGVGMTKMAELKFPGGSPVRTQFRILPLNLQSYERQYDGMVGWPDVKDNVWLMEAATLTLKNIGQVAVDVAAWTRFQLSTNHDVLALEIPELGTNKPVVYIDTGKPTGITLNPERWQQWKAGHTRRRESLVSYYMLGVGNTLKEESWADEMILGSLVLTEVPVMEANSTEVALGSPGFAASLGMAALKRLDLVIDGKHNFAYIRLKQMPPTPYQHNRLGAAFEEEPSQRLELFAHVTSNSPAAEAGIRDGDVLLKVNEHDVVNLGTDPYLAPLIGKWDRPAGTQFVLTLMRGSEVFKTPVVLRDILKPEKITPTPAKSLAAELQWLTELGSSAFRESNYDQAIDNYMEIIRLKPDAADAFHSLGMAHMHKGEYNRAITDFSRVITLNPKNVDALFGRANAHHAAHDYAKAVTDYNEVARFISKDPAVFVNRGLAFEGEGKYDEALADFTKAIRLDTDSVMATEYRADVYEKKRDYTHAVADYKRAIQLKSSDPYAFSKLAHLLAACPVNSLHDGKKAVQYAQKACELVEWKGAYHLDVLAMAYAANGDFADAVKWEQTFLTCSNLPEDVRASAQKRLTLYRRKKPSRESN